MLETFYGKAGHRHDHQYLTSGKLQWHRGSNLFEQCSSTTSSDCDCDRIQQIYPVSPLNNFRHVKPPGNLADNGCIAFGQGHHPLWPLRSSIRKREAFYILQNTSIQNCKATTQSPMMNDGSSSPSTPGSLSPEGEEADCSEFRSPVRPPSPLSSNNGLGQGNEMTPKRTGKSPATQISETDGGDRAENCDDPISLCEDCAIVPPEFQSMLIHNLQTIGQNPASKQTASTSGFEYAPVHTRGNAAVGLRVSRSHCMAICHRACRNLSRMRIAGQHRERGRDSCQSCDD